VDRSPAEPLSAADAAALAALRRRFVERLPQRWHDIEQAADLAARVTALHRLAGAAGAFGLAELGDAARVAQGLAEEGAGAPLAAALAELRRLLDAAGRE
jgi:HPt (histidine-containing phosphotransfer) domain-containing protein